MGSKASDSIEGHYNYYGFPAYVLKQKNGHYASGFYEPSEGLFKAGGSVKKILWDGVKLPLKDAKKLIDGYSKKFSDKNDDGPVPDWILLPEEASLFLAQADQIRSEHDEFFKRPDGSS